MDLRFIILFSVLFFVFLLNRIYVWNQKKAQKEIRPSKKILSDNEIIAMLDDPLTGEKVTLSETPSESFEDVFYDENKKTSDIALSKFYRDDDLQKEFILIKNYLLDEGFVFKKFSANQITILNETAILSGYIDWSYSHSYHRENVSFFIADVTSKSTQSKFTSQGVNKVLFFWLSDFNFIGHYCFYKKGIVEHVIDVFDSDDDIIKGYEAVIIKKATMEKELLMFLKNLEYDGDLEIEANNSNLFIKVGNLAAKDNLVSIHQAIKNSLAAFN